MTSKMNLDKNLPNEPRRCLEDHTSKHMNVFENCPFPAVPFVLVRCDAHYIRFEVYPKP